ncbi:MAG: PrsW family glutamic-type intramembrane protease [Myxococcota bacterium]
MEKTRCCVCHEFFAPDETEWLGGRSFCKRHHELALSATELHWSRAGLAETALLAAFIGVVSLAFGSNPLPTSTATGLLLALIPAAIFMVFVYRQDRVEPEPIYVVAGVFVFAALLGHAVANPFADWLLARDGWQYEHELTAWIGSIGVRGTLAALFAYLAVRYSVYLTDEFDEPVDGVIYATAAMLGLATATNLGFIAQHDGVLPVAGATAMASTTLAHVAAGVVLGYGLGRVRFDPQRGQRWLALSFAAAAILHGALHELVVLAGTSRGTFEPLLGFGVAITLAAAVLASSHYITVRFARRSLEEGDIAFS